MTFRTVIISSLCFLHFSADAFNIDIRSVRATLSKPDTTHTLIYRDLNNSTQKTLFQLTPLNNERFGLFVDINGVEIGYAIDVFDNAVETKTQNIIIAYRKLKNAKITLNYQTLKGLNNFAENLSGEGTETQFFDSTKSSRIELSGLHNLYTFNNKTSLFEHFFLNKPFLSDKFDWALSIVGGWSFKRLTLENNRSIIFDANFLNSSIPRVTELTSHSINASLGPFLSIHLPNNINLFTEYKLGKGYINNLNESSGLKDSGQEKISALGLGVSWTSSDQKNLVLLRAWEQKGRHINSSFGDLSFIRFF